MVPESCFLPVSFSFEVVMQVFGVKLYEDM